METKHSPHELQAPRAPGKPLAKTRHATASAAAFFYNIVPLHHPKI
jgi:hypothetical protein